MGVHPARIQTSFQSHLVVGLVVFPLGYPIPPSVRALLRRAKPLKQIPLILFSASLLGAPLGYGHFPSIMVFVRV